MDNFDLRKYLAEGRLLKTDLFDLFESAEDTDYDNDGLIKIQSQLLRDFGGKIDTKLQRSKEKRGPYRNEEYGVYAKDLVIKVGNYRDMRDAVFIKEGLGNYSSSWGYFVEGNMQMQSFNSWDEDGVYNFSKKLIQNILNNQTSLNEKLSPEQQKRLDSLRDELRFAIDPDNEYHNYEGRAADNIRTDIRSEFGDKIANQIEDGEYEMHFPRDTGVPGFQPDDKLADKAKWGYNKYRITKAGKMNKQDVNKIKNYYKR